MMKNFVPYLIAELLLLSCFGTLSIAQRDPTVALSEGRYGEAFQELRPLLKAQPDNPRLWTANGIALEHLGRRRESLTSFERALRISPKFFPALEGATEVAYDSHDPRAAFFAKRVLELQPENSTANAIAGVLAFERRDCPASVEHFDKGRNAIAGNPLAISQFAKCLIKLQRPQDAVGVLSPFVEEHEEDEATRYDLGLAQFLANQKTEAIRTLDPLISGLQQPPSEALNLFAAVKAANGQIEDAIATLRKAITLYPRDERNYIDLATVCLDHDAHDVALDVVDVGIKNIPNSAGLYTMRGAIHAQLSEMEKAQEDFEEASRLRPEELYGSVGLSMLLRQNGRIDEAVALLRRKLSKSPKDPLLNYLLADALTRQGIQPGQREFRDAELKLQNCLRSKPDFAKAHAALGKLYVKEGRAQEAVREFQIATQKDPKDRAALNQLVLTLRQLGRNQEAAVAAERLKAGLGQERNDEIERNRIQLIEIGENAARHR